MNKKKIYYNKKQIDFFQAQQKIKTCLWGRGTGKSTAIAGINYLRIQALPRAKVFFSSTTYNQILTKTLPPIEMKWNEMGLIEAQAGKRGHYVVGKRPPKYFIKPYSPPRKFENVITFWNGFTIEFLSLDRPDLARGGSYDGGDIDEAALIKKDHFTKILLPSIRGNRHKFISHLHQNINLYTSIPWLPSGQWIYEYEEKAKTDPEIYYFSEANYKDNMAVLGPGWASLMEKELPALEYMVEVENNRVSRVPDCFYNQFDESIHCYTPDYEYGLGPRGILGKGPRDYDPNSLLETSFDFSGWFNCCSVYQQHENTENCINSFSVKEDGKILDVVDRFCKYYRNHQKKIVRIWGEPRGHDRSPTGPTIYEQIQKRFKKNGWGVEIKAQAVRTTNHMERHQFIGQLMAEENNILPRLRINQETNKNMIIAIQGTQITNDFKKNKSQERNRNFPQEHAPHFTDTLDYYLMQKHGWKLHYSSPGNGNSVSFM